MAEILETFPSKAGTRGNPKYPFDEWFDGKTRKLYRYNNLKQTGQDARDFDCTVESMRGQLYKAASRRGIEVRTICGPDYIIVQRREA